MREPLKIGKLSTFCKVIAGQSPKGSAYNEDGVGVEFHQGKKAFGEHTIEPSNVWTTEITKLAQPGDILMSVRAPVGPTNFTDREVCIGRGLAAIRCNEGVLPQYILYALKSIESKIVGKDGAVFNSISKEMIEELPVPALDKGEQQRIVNILDQEFAKIDALKANAEKSLQAAKDLFQATLKKELELKKGWKTKTIGDVCDIRSGRNQKAVENPNGVYPIYGSGGIMGYADEYLCDEGATIIGRKGSINNPIFVETKFWNVDTAFGFSPKDTVVPKFLFYFCKSFNFQDMNKGTTIPSLVKTDLLQIAFPEPSSLKEQQVIVSRLDDLNNKCQRLQENYQKTLTLCNDLKQTLLRKAFNGEL